MLQSKNVFYGQTKVEIKMALTEKQGSLFIVKLKPEVHRK